jgi:hypothetical protein
MAVKATEAKAKTKRIIFINVIRIVKEEGFIGICN